MKAPAVFFLFILVITLPRCEVCSCKTETCPAFVDAKFDLWFPYTNNHQSIFQNNSQSDTITIVEIDRSAAYDAKRGCYGSTNGCYSSASIYSGERDMFSAPKFTLYNSHSRAFGSGDSAGHIQLSLYRFNLVATSIGDQGLVPGPGFYSTEFLPFLTLNGRNFQNVQMITKDTAQSQNKTGGPYKVYIARSQGLVAWEDYPSRDTWVKQ